MDGIDAALVRIDDKPEMLKSLFVPYQTETQAQLQQLISTAPNCNLDKLGALDYQIGEEFAATATKLLEQAGLQTEEIAAIGSHGQTARHRPADGSNTYAPYTLQIGDPNIIAERSGITTVADFRRRDMAAGGEGAPLLPIFHAMLVREHKDAATVFNIGGITNITVINGSQPVYGYDVGPGNCLINQWVQQHFKSDYDKGGKIAESGNCNPVLLARLLDDPYFKQAYPKSTGPEYFNLSWLEPHLAGLNINKLDVLRTLTELTASSIAKTHNEHAPNTPLFLCGGGVHNTLMVKLIKALLAETSVQTTSALGMDPDFMEAAAFAWLAKQTLIGEPGNLPSVTGATHAAVLGAVYHA